MTNQPYPPKSLSCSQPEVQSRNFTPNAIMYTAQYFDKLQSKIGRLYKNRWLLKQALTAPGAEEDNYEGHRGQAQMGELLLQFILGHRSLQLGSTRGKRL